MEDSFFADSQSGGSFSAVNALSCCFRSNQTNSRFVNEVVESAGRIASAAQTGNDVIRIFFAG